MGKGWIKIDRQILEWQWYSNPDVLRLFLHLLLKANITPEECEGKMIDRGEVKTSQWTLAHETGLSRWKVCECLKRLVGTGEISLSVSDKEHTIVRVNNYDKYQFGKKKHLADIQSESDNQQETRQENQQGNQQENQQARTPINKGVNDIAPTRKPASEPTRNPTRNPTSNADDPLFKFKRIIKEDLKETPILTDSGKEKNDAAASLSVEVTDLAPKGYQKFVEFWNKIMAGKTISPIKAIRGTRLQLFRARLKEYSEDEMYAAMQNLANSKFCNGDNSRGWVATFDWFIKPNNFPKVVEGNYSNERHTSYGNNSRTYISRDEQRRLEQQERIRRSIEFLANERAASESEEFERPF